MRICLAGPAGSVHLRRWHEGLTARGHDVHDLSHPRGGPPVERIRRALNMRRAIDRLRPDVVNVHMAPTGPTALTLWRLPRMVISVWGSDVIWHQGRAPAGRPFWLRFALRQAQAITSTSQFLAERTRRLVPSQTIEHVPFGVDCRLFSPQPKSQAEGQVRIGFVKHLERTYGPDVLLRAFASLIREGHNWHLVMAGGGSLRNSLQELAGTLGISNRVQFIGAIPHERVPTLLSTLTLFAMPTICDEALGVAALEASAMELPVVASRVGGVPEAVVDGETGILIPPGDPAALTDAMRGIIANAPEAKRLGEEGRRHVMSQYSWEKSLDAMEAVYANVA